LVWAQDLSFLFLATIYKLKNSTKRLYIKKAFGFI